MRYIGFLYTLKARAITKIRRPANAWRFRRAGKDLHVAFTSARIGMFAQLNFCLYMAQYAQWHGVRVKITLNSANYVDPRFGSNWFDYFFINKQGIAVGKPNAAIIANNGELPFRPHLSSLREAHDTFFGQFKIKSGVTDRVDDFALRQGLGTDTLGIHYRGTDKSKEAEPVPSWLAIAKIRAAVVQRRPHNIFVASDEASFIEALKAAFPDVPVISHDNSVRATGAVPIHLGGARVGNYEMGRDALINALLLARCGRLIRTASTLSAWSSVFNPDIEVHMLNIPKDGMRWFPETLVVPIAQKL